MGPFRWHVWPCTLCVNARHVLCGDSYDGVGSASPGSQFRVFGRQVRDRDLLDRCLDGILGILNAQRIVGRWSITLNNHINGHNAKIFLQLSEVPLVRRGRTKDAFLWRLYAGATEAKEQPQRDKDITPHHDEYNMMYMHTASRETDTRRTPSIKYAAYCGFLRSVVRISILRHATLCTSAC